jgi:hypothetical protein
VKEPAVNIALSADQAAAAQSRAACRPTMSRRLALIAAAFAFFNSLRVFGYLPTLLAIQSSGQADQHSLFTWVIFAGANTTMALWLHEQNGGRIDRAVAVNAVNAVMCTAIAACVAWFRWC